MSLTPSLDPGTLAGVTLTWHQHSVWSSPSWQLRADEHVWVTLRRERWFGATMVAELESGPWRVGPIGWIAVALTRAGSDTPAVIRRGIGWPADETTERLHLRRWRGDGPLERPDGRRWFWRQHGMLRDVFWEVLDEQERALATYTRIRQPLRIEGRVTIGDAVASRDDALEAAVFGWYLLMRETARRRHAGH